jgi:hypothetical protein
MYLPIPDDLRAELTKVVAAALGGDEFQKRVSAIAETFLNEIKDDLLGYIEYALADDIKTRTEDVAREIAQRFLEALANGDAVAVAKFIGDPPGYNGWQRDPRRMNLLDGGPIELRRKMIEACGATLTNERILDLEAQLVAVQARLDTTLTELHRWRTGEKTFVSAR